MHRSSALTVTTRGCSTRSRSTQGGTSCSGIEARVYFLPAHQQPVLAETEARVDLPVTDAVATRILSLPVHTRLTDADLAHVVDVIRNHR